jgi:uncharacterized small protein (DUF1192 family)
MDTLIQVVNGVQANTSVGQAEKEASERQARLEALGQEAVELRTQNELLRGEISRLQAAKADCDERVAALQAQINDLKAALSGKPRP